jgi:uncharacterized protein YkwD
MAQIIEWNLLRLSQYNTDMKRKRQLIMAGIIVLVAAVLVGLILNRDKPTQPEHQAQQMTDDVPPKARPSADELIKITNEERAKAGVNAVVLNPILNQTALIKAEEMERTGSYTSVNPETGKKGLAYIHAAEGINCIYVGENLNNQATTRDSRDIMEAWLNSGRNHRAAILDPRWEEMGFGISENYVVQHFCDVT